MTDGRLLVAHNAAFDMSVLRKSADHHRYRPPPVEFVCTEKLARVAAPQQDSYRLDSLAAEFGLPLMHHDPLSDATAAGLLWLLLLERSGLPPEQWLRRCGYRGPGYCRHGLFRTRRRARPATRPEVGWVLCACSPACSSPAVRPVRHPCRPADSCVRSCS